MTHRARHKRLDVACHATSTSALTFATSSAVRTKSGVPAGVHKRKTFSDGLFDAHVTTSARRSHWTGRQYRPFPLHPHTQKLRHPSQRHVDPWRHRGRAHRGPRVRNLRRHAVDWCLYILSLAKSVIARKRHFFRCAPLEDLSSWNYGCVTSWRLWECIKSSNTAVGPHGPVDDQVDLESHKTCRFTMKEKAP